MTRNIDLEHARKVAMQASEKASELLKGRFGSELDISTKGHSDYVTELDSQCEEIIRETLSRFDDSIEFVGEESTTFSNEGDRVKIELPDTCWIVDPLDGTSNYMHTFSVCAVSIALRIDGQGALGIVQGPVTGDLFYAIQDQGAHRVMSDSSEIMLRTMDNGNEFNLFSSSVPFRTPEYIDRHSQFIRRMYSHFEDLRRAGAAALDLAWVASGPFSTYIEMFLKPWDTAAGAVLVREAGGIVTDFSGDENEWQENGQIIASASPRVHELVLSLIE